MTTQVPITEKEINLQQCQNTSRLTNERLPYIPEQHNLLKHIVPKQTGCAQRLVPYRKHIYLGSSPTCVFTLLQLHFLHFISLAERECGAIKSSNSISTYQAS